ncbi:LPS export ABC transporter permease LptG [Nereida sp. MMG025]|uniref:LPS export ABC transporter permease LptG n=1 Tax=Nereida sp. MMG025 TaxID=2909981 RepID=UPI001EFFA670|nr:LPS export ABC transporter permease LptG [Nereida sp. MMG025]MCF6443443.1 LPS export ABC transporter permease LptG [Nereida sp. MMG025]
MRLHLYFALKFLRSFLVVTFIFFVILMLIDLVEQLRRYSGENVSFADTIGLSVLNVPTAIYTILPLLTIIATVTLFLGLSRTSELVVTRAAGRSALRSLMSPVLVAGLVGVIAIAAFNPIVAATQKQYELRSAQFKDDTASVLSISDEGLWLRQGGDAGQTVIRAVRANLDGTTLQNVTFLTFSPDGTPTRRIEADSATLTLGAWTLLNAKEWELTGRLNPEQAARTYASLAVATDLTRDRIQDSFGTPSAIPIWELPTFISDLERAGFSAQSHRIWYQMELALPLFLIAMVMIGAGFTMRHVRFGKTGQMVLMAILTGFGLYFVRNFAQVLGENGQIPILLAAWAPPIAGICGSLALLLHLEDG